MLVLVEMVQGYGRLSSAALESVNQTLLVNTFSSLSKAIVLGPSPVRSALLPRNFFKNDSVCNGSAKSPKACKGKQSTTA